MTAPSAEPDVPTAEDPRVSLANERTLLAWIRTALSLVAGGLAVVELLGRDAGGLAPLLFGLPLIALGGVVTLVAHRTWRSREEAIRQGRRLAPSPLPLALASGVALAALGAAVVAVDRAWR